MAVDELIDVLGRSSIETVLALSARQVAGAPQQGKARVGDIVWHGTQPGRVCLKERKLRVSKPRLRKKGPGANKEVVVPAYESMQQDTATGQQMLGILLNGVSRRRYAWVIPEMADTVGVSRSTVSREVVEAFHEKAGRCRAFSLAGASRPASPEQRLPFPHISHPLSIAAGARPGRAERAVPGSPDGWRRCPILLGEGMAGNVGLATLLLLRFASVALLGSALCYEAVLGFVPVGVLDLAGAAISVWTCSCRCGGAGLPRPRSHPNSANLGPNSSSSLRLP